MMFSNHIIEPSHSPWPGFKEPMGLDPYQDVIVLTSPSPVRVGKAVEFHDLGAGEPCNCTEEHTVLQPENRI